MKFSNNDLKGHQKLNKTSYDKFMLKPETDTDLSMFTDEKLDDTIIKLKQ